jgi:hypothetical protein
VFFDIYSVAGKKIRTCVTAPGRGGDKKGWENRPSRDMIGFSDRVLSGS